MKRWTGEDINEDWVVEKMTLTTGQTVMAFVLIMFLYSSCLLIFLGEVLLSFGTKRALKTMEDVQQSDWQGKPDMYGQPASYAEARKRNGFFSDVSD